MTKAPNTDFSVKIVPHDIYHKTAADPTARGPHSRALQIRALAHVLIRAGDTNMGMDCEFGVEECHQIIFQLADELAYDLEKKGLAH